MSKILVGLAIVVTYILMVMGNVVTTTGSGLACPDWPLCYGTVVPPREWAIWFEWGHRLLGGIASLSIVAATIVVWRNHEGLVRWLTGAASGLLVLGVIMGGVIVKIEAPLLEGPLHLVVISFHIVLSTIIFTLMILAYRRLPGNEAPVAERIYPILFGMVFLQVFIGIFVRYGYATMACDEFPTCVNEQFFPSLDSFEIIIHFVHRLVAYLIFTVALVYLGLAIKAGKDMASAAVTFGLVLTQAAIGIYVVLTSMFFPLLIGHGAFGFLTLGWLAYKAAPNLIGERGLEASREAMA
jgi:cytochrome c oxidase assembly protein subunit 15